MPDVFDIAAEKQPDAFDLAESGTEDAFDIAAKQHPLNAGMPPAAPAAPLQQPAQPRPVPPQPLPAQAQGSALNLQPGVMPPAGAPPKPAGQPPPQMPAQPTPQSPAETIYEYGEGANATNASIDQYGAYAKSEAEKHPALAPIWAGFSQMASGVDRMASKLAGWVGLEETSKNLKTRAEYLSRASQELRGEGGNPIVAGLSAAPGMAAQFAVEGPVGFGLDMASATYDKAKADGRSDAAAAGLATLSGTFNAAIGPLLNKIPVLGPWMEAKGSSLFNGAMRRLTHSEMMMELMALANGAIDTVSLHGSDTNKDITQKFFNEFLSLANQSRVLGEGVGFAAYGAATGGRLAEGPKAKQMRAAGIPEEIVQRVDNARNDALADELMAMKSAGVPDELITARVKSPEAFERARAALAATTEVAPEVTPDAAPEITTEVVSRPAEPASPVEPVSPASETAPDSEVVAPPPAAEPVTHPDQPLVDTVTKSIESDYLAGESLTTPEGRPAIEAVDAPSGPRQAESDAANAIGAALGRKVVWIRNNRADRIRFGGVQATEDAIMIDADAPNAFTGIVTHETVHTMETRHPEEYQQLQQAFEEADPAGKGFEAFRAGLEADYRAQGIAVPAEAQMRREFVADTLQKFGTEESFWQRVYDRAPEAAKRLFETVKNLVAKLTNAEVPRDTTQYLKDIEKVRDAAATFFAKVAAKEEAAIPVIGKETGKRSRTRKSESINPGVEGVRDDLRNNGLYLGRSANVEELRLPPGAAIKIHDKSGPDTLHIDDLMQRLVDENIIPEDRINDYSAIGELMTGRLKSPKDLEREESAYLRDKALADATFAVMQGSEPTADMLSDFPELAELKGYGRSIDNPADIDGAKAYYDGESWRVEYGNKWRTVDDPAIVAELRRALPYAEEQAAIDAGERAVEDGLPFSLDPADKPRRSLAELLAEKYDEKFTRASVLKVMDNPETAKELSERLSTDPNTKDWHKSFQASFDNGTKWIRETGIEESVNRLLEERTGLPRDEQIGAAVALINHFNAELAKAPDGDSAPALRETIYQLTENAVARQQTASARGQAMMRMFHEQANRSLDTLAGLRTLAERIRNQAAGAAEIDEKSKAAFEAANKQLQDITALHQEEVKRNTELMKRIERIERQRDAADRAAQIERAASTAVTKLARGEGVTTPEDRAKLLGNFFKRKIAPETAAKLSIEGSVPEQIMSALVEDAADFFKANRDATSTDYLKWAADRYGDEASDMGLLDSAFRRGKQLAEVSRKTKPRVSPKPKAKEQKPVEGQPELPVGEAVEPPTEGVRPTTALPLGDELAGKTAAERTAEDARFKTATAAATAANASTAIRKAARGERKTIMQIAKEHFNGLNPEKTLFQKIIDAGVSPKDAAPLAVELQKTFGDIMQKQGERTLRRKFGESKVKISKPKDAPIEAIMADIRRGALTQEGVRAAFEKHYGLQPLNEAQKAKMQRLADAVKQARAKSADPKTDVRVREAEENAMRYVASLTKVGWGNVAKSWAYFSLLSGIRTHSKNVFYTSWSWATASAALQLRQIRQAGVSAGKAVGKAATGDTAGAKAEAQRAWNRLAAIPLLAKVASQGQMLGLLEGAYVLKNGPRRLGEMSDKYGDPDQVDVFELDPADIQNPKIARTVALAKKGKVYLNKRLMMAEDLFFRLSSREQYTALATFDALEAEGTLTGRALAKEVSRRMGYTGWKDVHAETKAEQLEGHATFLDKAKAEGLKGYEARKRAAAMEIDAAMTTAEKLYGKRDPNINAEADAYGADITLNREKPAGMSGRIAHDLQGIGNNVALAWPFTRFLRVAANARNMMLEHTPIGFYRAYKGIGKNLVVKKGQAGREFALTPIERETQFWRASMGTALAGYAIAQMVQAIKDWQDDPEKDKKMPRIWFTARGSSNVAVQKESRDKGIKPYSIVIDGKSLSLVGTPFQYMAAIAGEIGDQMVYGNEADKAMDLRMAAVAQSLFYSDLNNSFLTGAKNAYDLMSQRDPATMEEKWAAFVGSFAGYVAPAALRQVGDWMDPAKYRAETLADAFVQRIPVVRGLAMEPDLNLFGEPIVGQYWDFLGSDYKPSPELQWMINAKMVHQRPDDSFAYPAGNFGEEPYKATKLEYYRLMQTFGPEFKRRVAVLMDTEGEVPSADSKEPRDIERRKQVDQRLERAYQAAWREASRELVMRRRDVLTSDARAK